MWEGWQVVLLGGGERGGDGPPGVPIWVGVAAVCGVPPGRWVPDGVMGCWRGDCDGQSMLAVLPMDAWGFWLCGRLDSLIGKFVVRWVAAGDIFCNDGRRSFAAKIELTCWWGQGS